MPKAETARTKKQTSTPQRFRRSKAVQCFESEPPAVAGGPCD